MNNDSIKLPLDIELDDKALASIAKRLVSVSKTFSSTLEKDITRVAFSLQQMGYANKGDVVAKIKSYLPPKTKLSSVAEYGLSAGAGRGVDESRRVIRTRRDMARQQAAEARAQAKEEERRIRWEKAAKSTYERYQYAQDIKEAKQIQAVAAAETQAENIQKREEVKKAVEEENERKVGIFERQYAALSENRGAKSALKWRDNLLKEIKKFHKDTKGGTERSRQIESYLNSMNFPKNKVGALLGLTKNIVWARVAQKALRYISGKIMEGFKAGEDAFTQHAIYGPNRDLALSKTLANKWGISEQEAAAPQIQALDFRQRLMYGQVGDQEIIGLSRMGEYGRMVMSGRAAQDPRAAMQALYEFVHNNDEAVVRSAFGQANLPLNLMKALQQAPTFENYYKTMQRATQFEELSSMAAMRVRGAKSYGEELLRSAAGPLSSGYYALDPEGRRMIIEHARSKMGFTDEDIRQYIDSTYGLSNEEVLHKRYGSLLSGISRMSGNSRLGDAIDSLWSGNVNNEITINVKTPEEGVRAADEVQKQMTKQSMAKGLFGKTISDWF